MSQRIFDLREAVNASLNQLKQWGEEILEDCYTIGSAIIYAPWITSLSKDYQKKQLAMYLLADHILQKYTCKERSYQTGPTPPNIEVALESGKQKSDPKRRCFIPFYEFNPASTSMYQDVLYNPRIIPTEIPGYEDAVLSWGHGMKVPMESALRCMAVATGRDLDHFVKMGEGGVHLVASTFADLAQLDTSDEDLAGEHKDCNLLSGHCTARKGLKQKSPKTGEWSSLDVPDDCVGIQPAEQLEKETNGEIKAVTHKAIFDASLYAEAQKAREKGEVFPRQADQLFYHCNPHQVIGEEEAGLTVVKKLMAIQLFDPNVVRMTPALRQALGLVAEQPREAYQAGMYI